MRLRLLLLFVLAAAIRTPAQTSPPERDFQIWTDTYLTIPVIMKQDGKTGKLSLVLTGTFRIGRNVSGPVDERIAVGLEFRANRFVTFTPSYLYRAGQPYAGRREFESRLRFDVGLEKKFGSFTIKDRNRIEHRFRNFRPDSTRYRNKFQLAVPVRRSGKEKFEWFVADEPYIEFQSRSWTRNEFSAGIIKKYSGNFSAEYFYMLQNNRGASFKYVHAVGITLKFKIDR